MFESKFLAMACSSASIARIKDLNRQSVDVLAFWLNFYYSLSYELISDLAEIRGILLTLHRTTTLRHDDLGQKTLLNLLLKNYLHYNLYDQAEKLRSKAPHFEAHANQQVRNLISLSGPHTGIAVVSLYGKYRLGQQQAKEQNALEYSTENSDQVSVTGFDVPNSPDASNNND